MLGPRILNKLNKFIDYSSLGQECARKVYFRRAPGEFVLYCHDLKSCTVDLNRTLSLSSVIANTNHGI